MTTVEIIEKIQDIVLNGRKLIGYCIEWSLITGEYYCALLDKSNDAIREKRPHLTKKNILLQLLDYSGSQILS